MRNVTKLGGLFLVGLMVLPLGGCSTSGARPTYHMSSYNYADAYVGGYGYRRVGYYGGYGHRRIGRPYGGYRRAYRY
jgi:hypothetical protein